jgi:hypothetical protein
MITRFNAAHQDLVMQRSCGDYPDFYAFAEQVFDCLNSSDTDCACKIDVPGAEDMTINLLQDSLQLQELNGVKVDVNLPFAPLKVFGLDGKEKEYLSLQQKGQVTFEGVQGNSLFLWKTSAGLTAQRDWGNRACTIAKDKFTLCVEQKGTAIPRVVDKTLVFLPVRIKFSVYLPEIPSGITP